MLLSCVVSLFVVAVCSPCCCMSVLLLMFWWRWWLSLVVDGVVVRRGCWLFLESCGCTLLLLVFCKLLLEAALLLAVVGYNCCLFSAVCCRSSRWLWLCFAVAVKDVVAFRG